jgi:two-component system cell cycle response regulator
MSGKTILAIEDNELNMMSIRALLQVENVKLLEAKDAESGVQILHAHKADLILIDGELSKRDGYSTVNTLKNDPILKNIPIITLIDDPMREDIQEVLKAGSDSIISKPILSRSFLETLKRFLDTPKIEEVPQLKKQAVLKSKSSVVEDKPRSESVLETDEERPFILLADNNETDIEIIQDFLEEEYLRLEVARKEKDAFSFLQSKKIDLILLDILFPGLDEDEIYQRFKNIEKNKDVPIIMITSLNDLESKIKDNERTPDDFLVRPIVKWELLARIKFLLEKRKKGQRLRSSEEIVTIPSIFDWLTGLFNSRYIKRFLDLEIKRALRYGYPISLIKLDVDDFKKHNARFGRPLGNLILREVAEVLRGSMRDIDLAGRYGGDEFAIVLPYADREGATQVADRILNEMQGHKFTPGLSLSAEKITICMGIVECPSDAQNAEEIFEKADRRLFKAKKNGKNQFCASD